jgi:site-specific recombinase XerD
MSANNLTSTYVLKPEDYYRNFKESIKSKETLDSYDRKLKAFMKYKRITDFARLIEDKDTRQIESDIIDFIISLKEKHYSLATQQTYLYALIHFYDVNDITIRRKKIAKFLSNDDEIVTTDSNDNGENGDKPYTREQIAKLLDFADIRTRVIILLMSSSGMRIGALPLLKICDLTPIPTHNIYQIRVYANSKSNRHYTFCTPECRKAIDNYRV